jgi:Uma2 family endonuclease
MMSGTLIPPESEVFPNRIRWTVDDCDRLRESGCLNGRYELIDGEIISKMGRGPTHSFVLQLIAEWLVNCFGLRRVRTQLPVSIPGDDGAYTEPEPDLVVTTQAREAYRSHHPKPEDALLVIEISDTTVKFDLGIKAHAYARAGVAEYWVVDADNRRIHVHNAPTEDGFTVIASYAFTDVIPIPGLPAREVRVESLFPSIELPEEDSKD